MKKAAIYCRLSEEDKNKLCATDDSGSIQNQKAMLVRELLTQCPKTTVVSGNGMAGYADTNEIRTRRMMQRLYVCGDQSTGASDGYGLIAPRVAVCAAHEANKVLQVIME